MLLKANKIPKMDLKPFGSPKRKKEIIQIMLQYIKALGYE